MLEYYVGFQTVFSEINAYCTFFVKFNIYVCSCLNKLTFVYFIVHDDNNYSITFYSFAVFHCKIW